MLKELKLENYRGFSHHTIPFKKLNVIVGANNAGKSSIVEALRITSFVVNRYNNLTYKKAPDWVEIAGKNYGVAPSLKNAEINFDSVCNQYNNDKPAKISATFTDGSIVSSYLNNEGNIHSVIESPTGKIISSRSEAKKISLPSINILPQVGPVQRDEIILDPDYVKSAIGSPLSPFHFRNQLNIYLDIFPEFQEMVEKSWTGVMVNELINANQLPKTSLFLQVRNGNFVAEVAAMGHGLQMWLQVIWFITLFKNTAIMIFDEPDVYMHADLQKRLIRFIKNKFPQVILTTHSIEIMSEVEPEDILIIDKNSTKSKFAINIPAVQRVAESTGSIHNINLARLWKAKKFLLLEGDDLKYLKIIQNKVFPRSLYPIDSIPNLTIHGWGGWNYAVGSSMLLFNSFKEKIIIYCILDSDYHSKSEKEERLKDAKSKGIDLHIWHKKEIENYFIIPAAIQRIINKRSKGKYSITISTINKKLLDISNSFKDNVTDCIANEIFQRNKSLGLQNANKEARSLVQEVENNYGNILSIISGKDIISEIALWTQNNFKLSVSPVSILNELNRSEIDEEILKIINSIETNTSF
jgi:AAA15 family ATPase/GTPase